MSSRVQKITDEDKIEAGHRFDAERHRLQKDYTAMQARHAKEMNDLLAGYKYTFRNLFRTITHGLLDDPDEAFSKETHALDTTYLKFGDLYLVTKPVEGEVEPVSENDIPPSRTVVIQ